VGVGQLDPGLNSQVGNGVGQQGPQPLRADKLVARREGISPVQVYAGPDRADQGRCEALFSPGFAQDLARLPGRRPPGRWKPASCRRPPRSTPG
jgi:hypothetical protein